MERQRAQRGLASAGGDGSALWCGRAPVTWCRCVYHAVANTHGDTESSFHIIFNSYHSNTKREQNQQRTKRRKMLIHSLTQTSVILFNIKYYPSIIQSEIATSRKMWQCWFYQWNEWSWILVKKSFPSYLPWCMAKPSLNHGRIVHTYGGYHQFTFRRTPLCRRV